jgi:V8-like Glu-specific endopeptidase
MLYRHHACGEISRINLVRSLRRADASRVRSTWSGARAQPSVLEVATDTLAAMSPVLSSPPHRGWWIVGVAVAALGCADPEPVRTGVARDSVIYGEDTRRDVYAVDTAWLARLAVQSSVAFVSADHLVGDAGGRFEIISETLGQSNNLCPGEAFELQPAAATCSGVLVDDQLVLTAGHCTSDDASCPDLLLVFGYAITDPANAIALDRDAIYRCKSIPARSHGVDADGRRWDHAFIELDRPVSSARAAVDIAGDPPPVGSGLTVIGYPGGLPVKIDSGAELLQARSCMDYFTMNSDTFQSSSGSGVFDASGRLAGIAVRGGVDYEFRPEMNCAVARRVTDPDPSQAEQASYIGPAIASLCATGWPSVRLCPADPTRAPVDPAPCSLEPPVADEPSSGCAASGRLHDHAPAAGSLLALIALMLERCRRRERRRQLTTIAFQR